MYHLIIKGQCSTIPMSSLRPMTGVGQIIGVTIAEAYILILMTCLLQE